MQERAKGTRCMQAACQRYLLLPLPNSLSLKGLRLSLIVTRYPPALSDATTLSKQVPCLVCKSLQTKHLHLC